MGWGAVERSEGELTFGSFDGHHIPVRHAWYNTLCLSLKYSSKGPLSCIERPSAVDSYQNSLTHAWLHFLT